MNKALRIAILERDGYRCVYCGRTSADVELQVDHVTPRATGGSDDATNLVAACFDCNNGKRDNLIELPSHVTPGEVEVKRRNVTRGKKPSGAPTWMDEAKRRYPDDTDLAWIEGEGRWAVVAWCSGLTVALYREAENAARALDTIDKTFCGHACWGDHQLVDLSREEQMFEDMERARGKRRSAHYESCSTCRYLSEGSGVGAAVERMSMRCIKAGRQVRIKTRELE